MGQVSFVFQDVYLFGQSILENIRMGRPDATEDEVIRAAKAAMCHEFISRLPKGYDTVFGQEGVLLSGGEARLDAEKQTQEYLDGIKVIRTCGLGGERFQALNHAFLELKWAAIQVELATGSLMALSTMLLRSGIGTVTFVGVNLITSGQIDFLVLLIFLLIASRIYGPILTVLTMLPDLLYLKVSTGRLRTLMESEPMAGRSNVTLTNISICFDRVSFSYHKETVLQDVSFTAKQGEVTALVGPSGRGKVQSPSWPHGSGTQIAARYGLAV